MNIYIHNESNAGETQIQAIQNRNPFVTFSSKIQKTCHALMIDLPLSTLSRVRSISERAIEKDIKEKEIIRGASYLMAVPPGDMYLVYTIQKEKTEEGKTEIVLIEQRKNIIERELIPAHANFLWKTLFPSVKRMDQFTWSYLNLEDELRDITWEVCNARNFKFFTV